MASITIRNVDAETAAAVRRDAAARGRTLAAELRELAGRAGILKQVPANNGAAAEEPRAKRELTTEEKLAVVDRCMAMQPRPSPMKSEDLVRLAREEADARILARLAANPTTRMTEEDGLRGRAERAAAMRERKRKQSHAGD